MFVAFIPILDSVIEFIAGNLLDLVGGIGAVLMLAVGWIAKKYLVPLLETENNRRYAAYIAAIADEVTDELKVRYPEKTWISYLDEAVDKIIEICDISAETARRAAVAAISRK